jgi:hypothetical protein
MTKPPLEDRAAVLFLYSMLPGPGGGGSGVDSIAAVSV